MRSLTEAELRKLSFPDCTVEEMIIDASNQIMLVKTNSGFLSNNGGVELTACKLQITNWSSIKATIYHAKTKKTENLDIEYIGKFS